jgi:hypothetical protein
MQAQKLDRAMALAPEGANWNPEVVQHLLDTGSTPEEVVDLMADPPTPEDVPMGDASKDDSGQLTGCRTLKRH